MAADPYIDPASGILANKLGITDPGELQEVEYALAQKAAPEALKFADGAPDLDEAVLKRIHHILFKDVYEWAGETRKVALAKGKTVFAPVRALHGYADREILPRFRQAAEQAGDDVQLSDALSEAWGELNALHPFREGNGRTTQVFVTALAHRYDRDIDWRKISRTDELAAAEAAMRFDYGGYTKLLTGAMRSWARGQAPKMLWPESGKTGKS